MSRYLLMVSAFDYDAGGPVVARHLALAAGWAENGGRTVIALMRSGEPDAPADRPGVAFEAMGSPRARGRLSWRVHALRKLSRRLRELKSAEGAPLAILAVDRDPILLAGVIRLGRRMGAPVVHEITEYPDVVSPRGPGGWVNQQIFARVLLRRLSGVIVVSPQVGNWVRMRAALPTLLVSGVVDLRKFHPSAASPPEGRFTLGYCGSLVEQKDGVRALISAVGSADALIGSERLHLRIIAGAHTTEQRQSLQAAIDRCRLGHRVEVLGPVGNDEVPALLAGCSALALPRPVSRQSEGGFPTKLGEYLAVGRAVIVTAVGSIPRSVRDGRDAILVAPDDSRALSEAIAALANEPERVVLLGGSARALAEESFAPNQQAARIRQFIEKVSTHG